MKHPLNRINAGEVHLSVVAPAFNEALGIETVVRGWIEFCNQLPFTSEIIISNDGSTDRTGEILTKLAETTPYLRVIFYAPNGGYGAALSGAIAHSRGKWVLTIDSDGQFKIEDFLLLQEARERSGADCAVGIRKKQDSPLRVLADKALRLYGRILFGKSVTDPNCALKLCRGELLRSLALESRGYSSPSEICFSIAALGKSVVETPVSHLPRLAGESKLKIFEAAWNVGLFLIYLRIKVSLYRRNIIYLLRQNRTAVSDTFFMENQKVFKDRDETISREIHWSHPSGG